MSYYDRWVGSGSGESLVLGTDNWSPNDTAEQVRKNLNAAHARGAKGGWLGGSRAQLFSASSEVKVYDWWDVYLDWTKLDGLTVKARVEVYTENAGTSVTARVKNVTDSANFDSTAYSTADTWAEQIITITAPAVLGVKKYRLYVFGSNTTNRVGALGQIEVYDAF